jgi:hypothetical protein
MLAKHVQVTVRRDMAEVIGTAVFEHEIEILRDIHGYSNVEEVSDISFEPIEIDSNEEFDRLAMVYGRNDEGHLYVERVIGRSPKQLEALAYKKPGRKPKEAEEV